jgi:spermidine/putrescine-binding protein
MFKKMASAAALAGVLAFSAAAPALLSAAPVADTVLGVGNWPDPMSEPLAIGNWPDPM